MYITAACSSSDTAMAPHNHLLANIPANPSLVRAGIEIVNSEKNTSVVHAIAAGGTAGGTPARLPAGRRRYGSNELHAEKPAGHALPLR